MQSKGCQLGGQETPRINGWRLILSVSVGAARCRRPRAFFLSMRRASAAPASADLGAEFEFFYDLRRRRRGSAPTVAYHQHWNVYDKKKINSFANTHSNNGARPPFDLLNYTQNTAVHKRKEGTSSFPRSAQTVTKCEGFTQANSSSKKKRKEPSKDSLSDLLSKISACRSHTFFFFIFSHHIPLLHCHSPSPVRERLLFALTVDFPGLFLLRKRTFVTLRKQ